MSLFMPMGLGLAGPMVVRPWDDLVKLADTWTDYYGLQPRTGHPFRDAPITDARGGVVYFDHGIEEKDFRSLLKTLGIYDSWHKYAVFVEDAADPGASRYVTQMRIMSTGALCDLFRALSQEEVAALPEQRLSMTDLFWNFVERESRRHSDVYPWGLSGLLGGDGDWAKEALCFGVMVENRPWMTFRIWTRAWLVTK